MSGGWGGRRLVTGASARRDLVQRWNPHRRVRPAGDIIAATASAFRVAVATLVSRQRHKEAAEARQAAALVLLLFTRASTSGIGRAIGRDHTTVIWACSRALERLTSDSAYAETFGALVRDLAAQRPVAVASPRAAQTPRPAVPLRLAATSDQIPLSERMLRDEIEVATRSYGAAIVEAHGIGARWP